MCSACACYGVDAGGRAPLLHSTQLARLHCQVCGVGVVWVCTCGVKGCGCGRLWVGVVWVCTLARLHMSPLPTHARVAARQRPTPLLAPHTPHPPSTAKPCAEVASNLAVHQAAAEPGYPDHLVLPAGERALPLPSRALLPEDQVRGGMHGSWHHCLLFVGAPFALPLTHPPPLPCTALAGVAPTPVRHRAQAQ